MEIRWGSFSDNSYNESIFRVEVGNNKELKLKMQMNMMGNNSTANLNKL